MIKYLWNWLLSAKKWILSLLRPVRLPTPIKGLRILSGWADLERDLNTGKRLWSTYDLESREILNMDFDQGLVFDPNSFPEGTQIRIFYPREPQ